MRPMPPHHAHNLLSVLLPSGKRREQKQAHISVLQEVSYIIYFKSEKSFN
ncbi:hypothetical protein LguiB_019165 [Lonicera macranthoides]